MIQELREDLQKARSLAASGDMDSLLGTLDKALADLSESRLLTMEEAAEVLGVKSPEALAPIMHGNGVTLEWRDDRPLVALSDVERVADSAWVARMRELDRLDDQSLLFGDAPMSLEELEALEAGRPGRPPWQRARDRTDQSE